MQPIGHIQTCYDAKFGVPRQPGLVSEAWGKLTFEPEYRNSDSLRGLEAFSHIWLIFLFHQTKQEQWKPMVRPPRLGGNDKVGVFASRSPFRPNPIGMSCVKLDHIDLNHKDGPILKLSGIDLVNGTPILDIKPYIPYSDTIDGAEGGFAENTPVKLEVLWKCNPPSDLEFKTLIESTIAADPRPAYQKGHSEREYGCLINKQNIRWSVEDTTAMVISC